MITRSSAARRLGISVAHLRRICKTRRNLCSFDGTRFVFDLEALEALAAERAAKRAAPTRPSVTTTAATKCLSVSRAHLRRMEERGEIRATRVGPNKVRYYDAEELEDLARERAAKKSRTTMTSSAIAQSHVMPAIPMQATTATSGGVTISVAELDRLRKRVRALEERLRATEGDLDNAISERDELRSAASAR